MFIQVYTNNIKFIQIKSINNKSLCVSGLLFFLVVVAVFVAVFGVLRSAGGVVEARVKCSSHPVNERLCDAGILALVHQEVTK